MSLAMIPRYGMYMTGMHSVRGSTQISHLKMSHWIANQHWFH